ncbi:HEXXH motif domain-containing protein [Streptomyces sp. NPDC048436]|uniref:HEXXH motif domain-containing protein n=1 Tax=Streptomyces sp. NPDC048436 TaxID=3365550 RepID=UPI003720068C
MAGESAISADLSFHHLSASGVRALARGEGGEKAVAELLAAERSRRLLLLRAVDDGLARSGLPLGSGNAVSHEAAWALLERVQKQSPEVFEDVLMCPHTGMWLSLALRRLRGKSYDDAPLWVVIGHLSALAAAAGARAGLDFSMTVPVRRGAVPLPTLGCAVLPAGEGAWDTAEVVAVGGWLKVVGADGEVVVPADREESGPGWHAVRRVAVGSGGGRKWLVLEELDPYRTFPRPSAPVLMSAAEYASWRGLLADAWEVLLRDDAESADAMRLGLMSVAPVPARERFRPYSGTAGDAFGSVTASHPDDAAQLAATLVHEFQHTKLGGLMHLEALTRGVPGSVPVPGQAQAQAQASQELFYAPWRDDPRPLGGLLQGIYAFAGVARFWRAHRHAADAGYAPLAHFEFALWRDQVWSTLNLVLGHEQLTPLGRRVVEALRERCAEWMADAVPPRELELAREAAADHRARWRVHHLRPPAAAVDEAVRAWLRGESRPPAALAAGPDLAPDPDGRLLDVAAILARYRITDPDGAWRRTAAATVAAAAVAQEDGVKGVGEADVLLACGDRGGARDAYAAQLSGEGAPVVAWVGLGRALAPSGDGTAGSEAAARLLCRYPERARAVQDALREATGRGADPVRLAEWLGRGGAAGR